MTHKCKKEGCNNPACEHVDISTGETNDDLCTDCRNESDLTQFQKDWITSTLAPESIKSIEIDGVPIHELTNQDGNKKIYVAEMNGKLYVNATIKDWDKKANIFDTFSDAVDIIVALLDLPCNISL